MDENQGELHLDWIETQRTKLWHKLDLTARRDAAAGSRATALFIDRLTNGFRSLQLTMLET